MVIYYNLLPIIISIEITKLNITNNEDFYDNADVMKVWTSYLLINNMF